MPRACISVAFGDPLNCRLGAILICMQSLRYMILSQKEHNRPASPHTHTHTHTSPWSRSHSSLWRRWKFHPQFPFPLLLRRNRTLSIRLITTFYHMRCALFLTDTAVVARWLSTLMTTRAMSFLRPHLSVLSYQHSHFWAEYGGDPSRQ